MWNDLRGSFKRFAGSSGNVDLPAGAAVIAINAHATSAGSVTFWDQSGGSVTVPVPANTWWIFDPKHANAIVQRGASAYSRITFTSTDSYFVEAVSPTGF